MWTVSMVYSPYLIVFGKDVVGYILLCAAMVKNAWRGVLVFSDGAAQRLPSVVGKANAILADAHLAVGIHIFDIVVRTAEDSQGAGDNFLCPEIVD